MTHEASLQDKNSFVDNAYLNKQRKWIKKLPKLVLKTLVSIFLVILAIAIALRLGLWQQASALKPTIEKIVSQNLNAQLHIKNIDTQWNGFKPIFKISNVELLSPQGQPLLSIKQIDGSISWRSLLKLNPRLSHLNIDNLQLTGKRDIDGSLYIVGQKIDPNSKEEVVLPEWLLNTRKIAITQTAFHWADVQKAKTITINIPTLTSRKKGLTVYTQGQIESTVLSAPLKLQAHFSAGLFGRIGHWQDWSGEITWNLPTLNAIPLRDFLPFIPSMEAGTLKSEGLAYFQKGKIERADISFGMTLKALQLDPSLPLVDLQSMQSSMSYQHSNEPHTTPHHVDIHTLDWQYTDGSTEHLQTLSFAWEPQNPKEKNTPLQPRLADHFKQIDFHLAKLNLAIIPRILPSLPLPQETRKTLLELQLSGYIEELKAKWNPSPDNELHTQKNASYSVSANLKNISLNSSNKTFPSFTQLSGKLQTNQAQGLLNLDSPHSSFTLPGIFEERIGLSSLQGTVSWQTPPSKNGETPWQISISDLHIENPDLKASANGQYTHDKQFLNIEGKVTRFALPQIVRYLPLQVGQSTLQFFKQSKLKGEAQQVKINVRGPLHQFPYADAKQGIFQIEIPVTQASLQLPVHHAIDSRTIQNFLYWPSFDKINGTVSLKQTALYIDVKQANVFNATLKNVSGKIPNLSEHIPRLQLTGEANGSTTDFLRFIEQSPLAEILTILKPMRAEGNGKLNLKLDLALSGTLNDKIEGRYTFDNNRLQILPDVPVLQAVYGDVNFTESDFSLNNIRGRFAGGTFKAQGSTRGKQAIQIQGTATVNGLYNSVSTVLTRESTNKHSTDTLSSTPISPFLTKVKPYVSGSVKYQAQIAMPQLHPDVRIQADLNDLGLTLPHPFNKPRGTDSRLYINWRKKESSQEDLSLQLDNLLQARYIQTLDENGQWHVRQGGIALNTPLVIPRRGVFATISLNKLNLDQWLELLDKFTVTPHEAVESKITQSNTPPNPYFPTHLRAQLDELILLNRKWEKLSINANSKASASPNPHWQTQLAGKQMQGNIKWTPANSNTPFGAISSRFSHLQIPDALPGATPKIETKSTPPQQLEGLPALQLQADRFEALGIEFGQVELNASNQIENNRSLWRLDKLALQHPAINLSAKGTWATPVNSSTNTTKETAKQTAITFHFDIHNGGDTLEALGIKKTLSGGRGKLDGELTWQSNPLDIDYSSLNGKLEISLKDGVFLKADPGVAKLLGILSFQIQNLQPGIFGLRGLTSQGFPFDNVEGSAKITQGLARSDDLVMNSSLATIKIQGTTSLKEKNQDLKVEVLPKIDLGSAALAYTAINPLLGVGSFLAQQLLGKSIGQAFAHSYTVTGSWSNPVVTKVSKHQTPPPSSEQ